MSSQWMGQKGAQPPNAGQVPVVTSILKDFSAEALGELRTWLEQNPPAVTISSIVGFQQFTAKTASTLTQDTTTGAGASYGDLSTTTGPSITGLPDGLYVVLFGAGEAKCSAGGLDFAAMSVSPNSASAADADLAMTGSTVFTSINRATTFRLANGGNNSLTCKYRTSAGTGTFAFRWLIAIRISN